MTHVPDYEWVSVHEALQPVSPGGDMLGKGTLYTCARHNWHGGQPCQECPTLGQRTDDYRAANTKYVLLCRQYDELVADNGRLLGEIKRLTALLARAEPWLHCTSDEMTPGEEAEVDALIAEIGRAIPNHIDRDNPHVLRDPVP